MQFPDVKKAIGVELSVQRHKQAMKIFSLMQDDTAKKKIELRCENMLEIPLRDADIVYISSLCFSKVNQRMTISV